MTNFDAFISYASEDSILASELAGGLKSKGFRIWYADFILKVGDKLLDGIERGLRDSKFGILLISSAYLEKGWTKYEMDVLIRQNIEKEKRLLPIWHEVSKEEVEACHQGLSGIYALSTDIGLRNIVDRLTVILAEGSPSRCVIPGWESPKHRFLEGLGELVMGHEDGPVFTIWEALINLKDEEYPIFIDGEQFAKFDLLLQVAPILVQDPSRVRKLVGKEGYKKIWEMCVDADLDPRCLA